MILKIGSFSFDLNEVWFIPQTRMRISQQGRYMYDEVSYQVMDEVLATSQANLTSEIQEREAAIRNITSDVVFLENDGTTETAHKIVHANTLEGIKARMIQYPGGLSSPLGGRAYGSGSEYADSSQTFRFLVTTISAKVLNSEQEIVFRQERYRHNLGGTQFSVQGAFQGLPRRFNIMQTVPNWSIQSGRIIGMTAYPPPPATIVGSLALDPDRSWVEPESPQMIGALGQWMWPVAYHYFYRDPLPMPGSPSPTP